MGSKDDIIRMMGLSAPQTMPEAALDDEGVRGVDLAIDDDALELSSGDLEAGIAAVFDAIRSSDAPPEDADHDADDTLPEDSGVTFALLTELNRLWERPPM
jgi:hypothetical protein